MSRNPEDRLELEREAGDLSALFREARDRTALSLGELTRPLGELTRAPGRQARAGTAALATAGRRELDRVPVAELATLGSRGQELPGARSRSGTWLRAAGVLVALALGAAGFLLMGGPTGGHGFLLAEVRRADGAVSLERGESIGCSEVLAAGSPVRTGDLLQCANGRCSVELSNGCLLVLSQGAAVRLDRAGDGSLRLTLRAGTLDYSTLLPRTFVCLADREVRCEGAAAISGLGGPDVRVISGCVLLRDAAGFQPWCLLPCAANGACTTTTRPR